MKKSCRYITSLFLTVIYLLITVSPAAPLVLTSKRLTHAMTGECSGDCKIDGCSHERSASHTCCCWQKKDHTDQENDAHRNTFSKPDTSAAPLACCASKKRGDVINNFTAASKTENKTIISTRPCGSNKLVALLSFESPLHFPSFFAASAKQNHASTLPFSPPLPMASRLGEPPEPPPIISYIS